MASRRRIILPLFIPFAGCPHRCVYCEQVTITGARAGTPDRDYQAAIRSMLDAGKGTRDREVEIAFYGGSFTALPRERQEALLALAAPFINSGEVRGIRLSTRPDAIEVARLNFLKERGVTAVELGVQSMEDKVLELSGRGHVAEDSRRAARLVKEHGFELGIQMMLGLPGDTPGLALRTALKIAEAEPDMVRIYPTLVFEGTPLADMWRRGLYLPWDLEVTLATLSILQPLFNSRGIPIGRIGLLLGSEAISSGRLLAGPFHPSLGWAARSFTARRRLLAVLREGQEAGRVFRVNPADLSIFLGEGRETQDLLREESGGRPPEIIPDASVPASWFAVC